jgi:predicted nucleic acid-binding protein
VIAYAESSAVLAWLLGEGAGEEVRKSLGAAERTVASTLTPLECGRALAREVAAGRIARADGLVARHMLDASVASWVLMEMTGGVLKRARAPFPVEPVRTLDALHLATALAFRDAHPAVTVVSLDHRIRDNARALGMDLAP